MGAMTNEQIGSKQLRAATTVSKLQLGEASDNWEQAIGKQASNCEQAANKSK